MGPCQEPPRLIRPCAHPASPPLNSFIGNSVSTFSALAMLERRHRGLWAAYYNGGNLPIAPYLPVHKVGCGGLGSLGTAQ